MSIQRMPRILLVGPSCSTERADSSARRERLPYKQEVTGSSPVPPTAWLLGLAILCGCAAGAPKPSTAPGAASARFAAPALPPSPGPAVEFPEPAGQPVAVVKTERGVFKFALLRDIAPNTVRNFISLSNNGFYANLMFHRVDPGVLIQTGDPAGNGTGGPGYTIKAEFNAHPHREGTVAMARRTDPDSAGSQWYVCLRALPELDRQYTVFGQCYEGLDVIRSIRKGDRILDLRIEYVDPAALPAEALR